MCVRISGALGKWQGRWPPNRLTRTHQTVDFFSKESWMNMSKQYSTLGDGDCKEWLQQINLLCCLTKCSNH